MRASIRGAALVFLALTVWGRGAAQENDPCAEKLKALAGAIENYRFVHGKPPEKLSQLYYQGFVESLSDFVCSESGHKVLSRSELDEKSDYTLEPMAGVENSVIREKAARAGRQILAAFADGSVRPVAPAVAGRDDQAQRRRPPSESGRIDQKKAEEPKLDDGIALFHAGRFHEALASFEQALRVAPGHSHAIYMRGSARLWTNDIQGALEDFRYLAEKDRTVESRRINASLELLAGDRQDAKEIAELLVLEAPSDARVHTLYGQALLWNGDVASATDREFPASLGRGRADGGHLRPHGGSTSCGRIAWPSVSAWALPPSAADYSHRPRPSNPTLVLST